MKQAQEIPVFGITYSLSKSVSEALHHDFFWTWTANSRRSIDQFTRPFHIGGKKKMIRKKTGTVSNRPLARLSSEAVSRRPHEGSGNGSHRRKRPTWIVRFKRAYLNCSSYQNDNTFGKKQSFRTGSFLEGLAGTIALICYGNRLSRDAAWSSVQPYSFMALRAPLLLMTSGAAVNGRRSRVCSCWQL